MNKMFLATVFALGLVGSAFAADVPTPPRRPANLGVTTPPPVGAVIKDGMVVVRAPVGSDMIVDVDGTDIDVSIEGSTKRGFAKILPWNWSIWK